MCYRVPTLTSDKKVAFYYINIFEMNFQKKRDPWKYNTTNIGTTALLLFFISKTKCGHITSVMQSELLLLGINSLGEMSD